MIAQTILVLLISSITIGHVIQLNTIDDLFIPSVQFDSHGLKMNSTITYYSYHIHVYFLQNKSIERNEAISLRNRFLSEFNVSDCQDHCETWCPRICHWTLNMSPVG